MDPITIAAAGGAAIGGLVQLYNSEQARGANKARLNQIEQMYNQVKPPDYNLKITDPPQLHEETLAKPEFSSALAAPKFNLDKITPQQYQQVGQFIPKLADYVAEKNPTLITKTADQNTGREAQLEALKKFQQVGAGGFDPEYQEKVTEAARAAQGEAQSRQNSLLQSYARRGQSGSGLALAAQLGGASQAMNTNAMSNLGAATQSYKNQLGALSQGAQLGGQIGQEDQNLQNQNANIINQFNQRMAAGQQNYQNQRAGQINQAQQYNLGVGQNLANMNTQGANQAALQQQQRQDELAKYGYQTQQQAQGRQDQLAQWGYGQDVGERNYQNQLATQKYNEQVAQQAAQNGMLSQQFNNQMAINAGKAGISNQVSQANTGMAQDRNSAIQGLSNIGLQYAQNNAAQNNAQSNQYNNANLAVYKNTGKFMTPDQRDQYKDSVNGDENGYY